VSDLSPGIRYVAGGTVQADDGIYVERAADTELLDLCRRGVFTYVLTSRQMGKSSLMIRASERLAEEGVYPVNVDLEKLGANTTAEQWYYGVLEEIRQQLPLATSLAEWWERYGNLGVVQRFTLFLTDVVTVEVPKGVVIFVDEIDSTLPLKFTDDFFICIRYLHNARAVNPKLSSLSFVLLGASSPGDLIKDPERTPFNIGQPVNLEDFTEEQAGVLHPDRDLVRSVLHFTNGHPYLTLRVFRSLAENPRTESNIDARVASLFFGEQSRKDSNLRFVRDMLTERAADSDSLLVIYQDVLRGKQVQDKEADPSCAWLRLSGIVQGRQGFLAVRNRIYEAVFDIRWVKRNRKVNWTKRLTRAAIGVGVLLLVLAAALGPWAYVQSQRAERRRLEAEQARSTAEVNAEEARKQRELADASRSRAEYASELARHLQEQAQTQSARARAGLLAAQAESTQVPELGRFTLGVLVAIESVRRDRSWQGDFVLRRGLAYLPRPIALYTARRPAHQAIVSDDGTYLARAAGDEVAVWDTQSGKVLFRVPGRYEAFALAFSTHGSCLALATHEGDVAVWNPIRGSQMLVHHGSDPISSMAVRSDCKQVAASTSHGLKEWDLNGPGKGGAGRTLDSREFSVIAFSPDDQLLAGGDATGRVTFWQTADGKESKHLDQRRPIVALGFSGDGTLLAASSVDGRVVIWDVANEPEPIRPVTLPSPALALSLNRSAHVSLYAVTQNAVSIFEISDGQEVLHANVDGSVVTARFSSDSSKLAILTTDNSLAVWEMHADQAPVIINTEEDARSIAFTDDSQHLFSSSYKYEARWSLNGKKEVQLTNPVMVGERGLGELESNFCDDMQPSSDGRYLFCHIGPESILFDLKEKAPINPHHSEQHFALVNGSELASLTPAEIVVRELGSDTVNLRWRPPQPVSQVFISRDGTYAAVRKTNGTVEFENLKISKAILKTPAGQESSVYFSKTGAAAVVGPEEFTIFDLRRGSQLARLRTKNSFEEAQFSPDGEYFSIIEHHEDNDNSDLRLWRLAPTGCQELAKIPDTLHWAFSSDGHLAVVGRAGVLRLLDLVGGQEMARLHVGGTYALQFAPDGKYLAISIGRMVLLLLWRTQDLIDEACRRVSRNFSHREWQEYFGAEPYSRTCKTLPPWKAADGEN
jgi:WD40 repeat protein